MWEGSFPNVSMGFWAQEFWTKRTAKGVFSCLDILSLMKESGTQIAKERSQIVGVHKIERIIQRINYKGNILLFAFFFVAAENGVQGGVPAYL